MLVLLHGASTVSSSPWAVRASRLRSMAGFSRFPSAPRPFLAYLLVFSAGLYFPRSLFRHRSGFPHLHGLTEPSAFSPCLFFQDSRLLSVRFVSLCSCFASLLMLAFCFVVCCSFIGIPGPLEPTACSASVLFWFFVCIH